MRKLALFDSQKGSALIFVWGVRVQNISAKSIVSVLLALMK